MKIAMWSGPRNLSTAMMYSFAARRDFVVWDEPFYAPYLKFSGEVHPMQNEILARHLDDPSKVAERCNALGNDNATHVYMKHMPHHMLDNFPMNWAKNCVNVHLIRHPARVIASYSEKRERITDEGIGFHAQQRVFEKLGGVVIDSDDIRRDPKKALESLCAEIGLQFTPEMLSWTAGPKSYDGVWAKHWYNAVHRSTGFAPAETQLPVVNEKYEKLYKPAKEVFDFLKSRALKVS